jgi:hypothetical protein
VGGFVAFDAVFPRVDWFGDEVVWLAPEPAEQFRRLTSVVGAAFPDLLPNDGEFDDVVPHLTIGGPSRGTVDELRLAADAVARQLPLRTRVQEVAVLAGSSSAGPVAHGRAPPAREAAVTTRSQAHQDAVRVEILDAVVGPLLSLMAVTAVVASGGDRRGLHGDWWSAAGLVLVACAGALTLARTGSILWSAWRRGR